MRFMKAATAVLLGCAIHSVDARVGDSITTDSSSTNSAAARRNLPGTKGAIDALNPVTEYSDLMIEWAALSERGPTITGHFMVQIMAAIFDARAAFFPGSKGVFIDIETIRVDPTLFNENWKKQACLYAMYDAAYQVMVTMGETMTNQRYLEEEMEPPEIASDRLEYLLGKAGDIRNAAFDVIDVDKQWLSVSTGISAKVVNAILVGITTDGSNYQNDYKDTTGYQISSWISPVPEIEPDASDYIIVPTDLKRRPAYNFVDGSWVKTFNTFDAITANDAQPNAPSFPEMNPAVVDLVFNSTSGTYEAPPGKVKLTESYQSLTNYGIFPPDKDGGEQFPLTPQWGNVKPVSFADSSDFRTEPLRPYDANGKLNLQMIDEVKQVVEYSEQQQAGNCPTCRATSEYWELGDEFPYPPGWWVSQATKICKDRSLDVKSCLQLVLGTAITVFDAGVAAWEMKYYYDTTRPFTLINEMFFGSKVPDWRCKPAIEDPYCQTAFTDDKQTHWRPYQLRRNIVPPFPDIPSGHSAFSTSSSVVLRNLLGTNEFNFISEPFKSRFDLKAGFDGDTANGNEDMTLSYATFSEAADEAGISRLYGGIHHMNGNVIGLEMGARVGHKTMAFLRDIFNEPTLGRSPVDDVWNDLIFGTGLNDTLTAKCSPTTPIVEVYGFYGDDVLEYSGNCGPASLFGGGDSDTFKIASQGATIQDYEEGIDKIEILGYSGDISASFVDGTTTVSVGGAPVVDIDGEWTPPLNQLSRFMKKTEQNPSRRARILTIELISTPF